METLATLDRMGIARAGAGRTLDEAAAPAILPVIGRRRVLVFAFASTTSGIPADWAARGDRPGINLLAGDADRAIARAASGASAVRRPGDLLVASIHWGGNWGYHVPDKQRQLAHRLIDSAGFDIVHGHSSHHPKGIEIYAGKLILYGCGDFINDYEGIRGYEMFRDDLAVAYLARCSASTGDLLELTLLPFKIRKFRLSHASAEEVGWLHRVLDRESAKLGVRIAEVDGRTLKLLRK